jgi:hypothetical protein
MIISFVREQQLQARGWYSCNARLVRLREHQILPYRDEKLFPKTSLISDIN